MKDKSDEDFHYLVKEKVTFDIMNSKFVYVKVHLISCY